MEVLLSILKLPDDDIHPVQTQQTGRGRRRSYNLHVSTVRPLTSHPREDGTLILQKQSTMDDQIASSFLPKIVQKWFPHFFIFKASPCLFRPFSVFYVCFLIYFSTPPRKMLQRKQNTVLMLVHSYASCKNSESTQSIPAHKQLVLCVRKKQKGRRKTVDGTKSETIFQTLGHKWRSRISRLF